MTLLLQSPSFELWWEPQQGIVRLQSPGRKLAGAIGIDFVRQNRSIVLSTEKLIPGRVTQNAIEDAHGQAQEAHIHYQEASGLALCLRIRLYSTRPFVLYRLSVTNVGPETIKLRHFFMQTTPDGFRPSAPPVGCYINGWQSWSPAGFLPNTAQGFSPLFPIKWLQGPMIQNAGIPWNHKPGRFWSETVGAVITSREALVAGGASLADQFVQVYADVRPGHQMIRLQSQADDIPLESGEACSSEWFYLEWVPLPNIDPLAQYAYAVARQMAIPTPKPAPTGWCSWYIYGNEVREADVMDNIASAALLADEIPLQVIQLDEGFQSSWGDWTERNARFPHKLKWLADRIRGSGFTPGLWLGPLTAHPKSRLASDHPDWLLRNRYGRPVSPGLISGFLGRALDPTHPGVVEHLHELIDIAVSKWGFPYLKLDFMYAGALGGKRHNPRMTRAQAMRQAFQVIRDAAGEETYLVGCGAPLGPAVGLVDAMRIGPDTASMWGPDYGRIGGLMQNNPSLPSLRNSLQNVTTRAWIHNRWWMNDPDTLMIRDKRTTLNEDEVLTQMTLLGLSGGLYLLSDDLDALPPERRAKAATLLPPLLGGMDVLDLFKHEMPDTLIVPVDRPWGRWRLLGLFNWQDQPVERVLPEDVLTHRDKVYHIVDFWGRRYMQFHPRERFPVFTLPAHGAVLLSLRESKPAPQLVGTTFHISQGAEITAWDASLEMLSLRIKLDRLARGEVWLALSARPKAAFLDDEPLPSQAIRTVSSGIWSIGCKVRHEGTLQVVWDPATAR